jgi:hypothetical protein
MFIWPPSGLTTNPPETDMAVAANPLDKTDEQRAIT